MGSRKPTRGSGSFTIWSHSHQRGHWRDIKISVCSAIAAIKSELTDILNVKLDSIYKKLKAKDEDIVQLKNESDELWRHINRLSQRQNAAEAYSRIDHLFIYGLPPSYSEALNTESEVDTDKAAGPGESTHFETSADSERNFIGFCSDLGISIQSTDIVTCHRLPRPDKSKQAPLIVRFTNRRVFRAVLLGARKLLCETKRAIYINKHLTKTANDIYITTRRLQKQNRIKQTWTIGGRVMIRLTARHVWSSLRGTCQHHIIVHLILWTIIFFIV